eukprot:6182420-Pleurochrysis_carterae.AAC.9
MNVTTLKKEEGLQARRIATPIFAPMRRKHRLGAQIGRIDIEEIELKQDERNSRLVDSVAPQVTVLRWTPELQ